MCAFALAAGVLMMPLAYRGGAGRLEGWFLVGACVVYVFVAAFRVARGLGVERQLDVEERFVQSARRNGLSARVKIGRPSTLVQAIRRIESVPAPEQRRALRGALRRSTQRLSVRPGVIAVPALIVLGGLWVRVVLAAGGQTGYLLLLAVVVVLFVLLALEAYIFALSRRLRTHLSVLMSRVVSWWAREQAESGLPSFTHVVLYRDVTDRLGIA